MSNVRNRSQISILDAYDTDHPELVKYTNCAADLLRSLIDENQIPIHSVTCRVKEKNSLETKINRPDKAYSQLKDVTDISGIRIITFLPNEVDLIAKLVEDEFDVDKANSIDKREIIEPDRFGYVSVHYVVSMSKERLKLQEYSRYAGRKCEIQIRSILQHAWAEIEHDLGYKSKIEVPNNIQRRFFRLAGLLEIADDEFTRIREDLIAYEANVESGLDKQPETILIDKTSLELFVDSSSTNHRIVSEIAKRSGIDFNTVIPFSGRDYVRRLYFCNIRTVDELNKLLEENEELTIRFGATVLTRYSDQFRSGAAIDKSFALPYLCDILVLKQNNIGLLEQYADECMQIPKEQINDWAKALTSTFKAL